MAQLGDMVVRFRADLTNLSAGLAQAKGQLAGFVTTSGQTIDKLGVGMQTMGNQMRGMGTNMLFLGTAVAGSMGLIIKTFAGYESAVKNAASVTGLMGEALADAEKNIGDVAQELGETTVFSASQAADALYDLASKGFDVATISAKEMKGILDLAAATQADLTLATEVTTATIRAFGLSTEETKRVADVMTNTIGSSAATIDKFRDSMSYVAPIAHTAGISLEETAAALGRIFDLGFPASMAGTALRRTLAELLNPSAKLVEALNKVGLEFEDIDLEANGLAGTLEQMADAGISASDMIALFGQRAGPTIAALIGVDKEGRRATEGIKELTQANIEASEGMGKAAQVAENQLKSLKNQFLLLRSVLESVAIELGEVLLPIISEWVTKAREVTVRVKEWIQANPDLVAQIGKIALALGPVLIVLGLFNIAIGSVIGLIGGLIRPIGLLITALGKLPMVLGAVGAHIGSFVAFLTGAGGMVVALGAVVVAIGIAVSKFIEMRQALRELEEANRQSATATQDRFEKIASALTKEYELQLKTVDGMEEQMLKIQGLIRARGELADRIMADGRVTEEEGNKLSEVTAQLLKQIEVFENMGGYKEKLKERTEALSEATEMEAEKQEKLKASLEAVGINYEEYMALQDEATEGVKRIGEEEEITGFKTQELTARLVEMRQELGDMKNEVLALADIPQERKEIKINFTTEGADELKSVTQEILRMEHWLALEQVEGFEKQKLRIQFDLEETLLALSLKREAHRLNHELLLREIELQMNAELEKARATKNITDEELSQIQEFYQERMSLEKEAYKTTVEGYERIKELHEEMTEVKLANLAKVSEANKGEVDGIRDVIQANAEATSSYMERANAARQAADSYSTPRTRSIGTSGTGSASSPFKYGSYQELLSSDRPLGSYSTIGSYQAGKRYVPQTGPYWLHEGERVTNKSETQQSERPQITIINQIDSGFVSDMIAKDPNTIINIIGSDVAKGGTIKKSIMSMMRNR